ncbi:MAG: hypothetical protein L3J71_07670 [Victivallaceae bacterium]|nr:hypothetical protein [Victivallaceae bacterium]
MDKKLLVPILTIIVGGAWLLNVLGIMPGVDWLWSIGLATSGILTIVIGKTNKTTIITGPFLLVASLCSILRQTDRLALDREIPILIIVLGVLMLISQCIKSPIPPEAMPQTAKDDEK